MSNRPTVFDALALRELARAATPGNKFNPDCPTRASGWQTRKCGEGWDVYGDDEDGLLSTIAFVSRRSDAEFIAAADPQTVLALVEEVERLRADVEKLTRERDDARASLQSITKQLRKELDEARAALANARLSRLNEFAKAALTGMCATINWDGPYDIATFSSAAAKVADATIRALDGAGGA